MSQSDVSVGEWSRVGEVALLQVQTGVMTGSGGYEIDMLVPVEALLLTPDGVLGLADGERIVDRHHKEHPAAKRWHAADALSFGFSSHYDRIRSLFGPAPLGIAGENVIVTAENMIAPGDVAGGVRVSGTAGTHVFNAPAPMEPCVEFTRFITSRPGASARDVKEDRLELRNGVRGYAVAIPADAEIRVGDQVAIRTA